MSQQARFDLARDRFGVFDERLCLALHLGGALAVGDAAQVYSHVVKSAPDSRLGQSPTYGHVRKRVRVSYGRDFDKQPQHFKRAERRVKPGDRVALEVLEFQMRIAIAEATDLRFVPASLRPLGAKAPAP